VETLDTSEPEKRRSNRLTLDTEAQAQVVESCHPVDSPWVLSKLLRYQNVLN